MGGDRGGGVARTGPAFVGGALNQVAFCGVNGPASLQMLPLTVEPAPPFLSPDCQKKRIGLVVGSAARAAAGVCGWCSRPIETTVDPHMPNPMLLCPARKRLEDAAQTAGYTVEFKRMGEGGRGKERGLPDNGYLEVRTAAHGIGESRFLEELEVARNTLTQ